jgi:hypothetical protein
MRTLRGFTVSIVAALASSAYASPQPDALVQQLRAAYPETMMDASGLKVTKPGATLVVQVDGMLANPAKNGAFANTFADGQLVKTETKSEKIARFGISIPQKKQVERPVAQGAKVYLLNTEFTPDTVAFTVQTCGDCDPKVVDPSNEPYRAKVTFKFVHGALAGTDLKHVQQTIEQVFKFPDSAAPANDAQAGAAAPQQAPPPAQAQQFAPVAPPPPPPQNDQQFAPIAPPPAPAAGAAPPAAGPAPRVLKLGMTIQEVKDTFGDPAAIIELSAAKVMYVYKDKKVTFVNGKVSDVEVQ